MEEKEGIFAYLLQVGKQEHLSAAESKLEQIILVACEEQ